MTMGKKIENFWYYHKWHTLLGALLLTFAIIISYQMFTKPVYDNSIVVAGNVPSTLADLDKFHQEIAVFFEDVNGDNEIMLNTTFVPLGGSIESVTDFEMAMQYPQQLQALISADDANVFIVSEDILIDYGKNNAFADVSDIQKELGLVDCKYNNGILISNKELISNLQLYPNVDYYIAVRVNDGIDKLSGEKKVKYENAYGFMKALSGKK